MTETDGVQCLLRSPTGEGRVINSLLRWHHSAYTRQQMADDKSQQFSSVYQRWRLVWRTDTDLRDWQKTQGGRQSRPGHPDYIHRRQTHQHMWHLSLQTITCLLAKHQRCCVCGYSFYINDMYMYDFALAVLSVFAIMFNSLLGLLGARHIMFNFKPAGPYGLRSAYNLQKCLICHRWLTLG